MEEQTMLQNELLLAELTTFITEKLRMGEDLTTPITYRFGDQDLLVVTDPEVVYEMARVVVEGRQFFIGPSASLMKNGELPSIATP